ncbi:hypothetical protein TNCV_1296051 [Trichonephila clavipes]|uniref:Uncharacterized protein n=1 Tax=Trichonephila clavipes TaxID=2585209 RepID=A0A8X6VN51_TRICX|nr:hypothetical protein TNCV_1296051 [Trichonephila clavipes]
MQKTEFQMLNDDEIVTSVHQESDPVDDESDEDEDNNNSENSKGPALVTAMEWYEQQSESCPTQLLLLKKKKRESKTLQRKNQMCTMCPKIASFISEWRTAIPGRIRTHTFGLEVQRAVQCATETDRVVFLFIYGVGLLFLFVTIYSLVVKIYRFWNSGAGGAGGAACKQKWVEVPPDLNREDECLEKKKLSLQESLDLLQNLPSESSDVLTDDSSHEEVLANNLLKFFSDSEKDDQETRQDPVCSSSLTATAGSDVVQSGRPIFDDFFQHLWPSIGNNTANVVFQMVKRLWFIRIDQ